MIEYSKQPAMVDAIEEGRIVKVPEDYARREGLLILRKTAQISNAQTPAEKKQEGDRKNKGFIGMEDLRKPLSSKNNEILKELVENFHWILSEKRRVRRLTRKKLADDLGESELNVKMIENGVLPANNFVMINKLESYYGVTLRKNKVASVPTNRPLRQPIDFAGKIAARRAEGRSENRDAIEIIDDVSEVKGGSEKKADNQARSSSSDDIDLGLEKF